MSEPLNPVQIERRLAELSNRIAKGVSECSKRYTAYLQADHEHDVAFAKAYLGYEGPQQEKRYAATVATVAERDARDAADAAYRFADRQARALESELRAMQSINSSVRSMYSVAGAGNGA